MNLNLHKKLTLPEWTRGQNQSKIGFSASITFNHEQNNLCMNRWFKNPRKHLVILSVLMLVGGGLRLGAALKGNPVSNDYYKAALQLKQSGIFAFETPSRPTAYRGIIYPGLIAALEPANTTEWSPRRIYLFQALLGAFSIGIVYACGAYTISYGAGLLAASLFAVDPTQIGPIALTEIEAVYTFILICMCGVLVWWAQKRTQKKSFALGAAVGICVLCRSVLGLFPFYLLILCAWRKDLFPDLKRSVFPLLAGFTLVILPWIARNAVQFGKLIPFDQSGYSAILYRASFGEIHDGDQGRFERKIREIQGGFPDESADKDTIDAQDAHYLAIDRAAMDRIMHHPWPYLRSFFFRSLIYGPFLLLFPWMVIRFRPHNPKVYVLAMLWAYHSIHLLMAINQKHLTVSLFVPFILLGGVVFHGQDPEVEQSHLSGALDKLGLSCMTALTAIYFVAVYWIGKDIATYCQTRHQERPSMTALATSGSYEIPRPAVFKADRMAVSGLDSAAQTILGQAVAAFDKGDAHAGFGAYEQIVHGNFNLVAAVDRYCGIFLHGCPSLKKAFDELTRLNDEGISWLRSGDLAKATQSLDKALDLYPNDFNTLMNRAAVADAAGEATKALEFHDRIIRLNPTRKGFMSAALSSRAMVLERLGRDAEAARDLRRALRDAPLGWPPAEGIRKDLDRLEKSGRAR